MFLSPLRSLTIAATSLLAAGCARPVLPSKPRVVPAVIVPAATAPAATAPATMAPATMAPAEPEDERTGPAPSLSPAPIPVADATTRFRQRVVRWGTTFDTYPLDQGSRGDCLEAAVVPYRSDLLAYSSPIRVHPLFAERLAAFEQLVKTVAIEVYGRAPTRLVHMGGFSCRTTAGSGGLSEHGLGNAIDVAGFDFAPDASAQGSAAGAFQVRVAEHWFATEGFALEHRRFLHALADRLFDHPEIFRRIIGPPTRLHHDHLHLDVGPSRHANFQFEEDRLGVPPERRPTP